ncbi:MAG: c-type cytochrome [Deltaproteobacteria bacterium]|nr:c-type cytochrome [Deltaproteobacteria bacterium]
MLSKSAARAFFLVGTAVCSLAFVGLTVDTFGRIPAQTHSDAITPEVARGKVLWEAHNCMGCHTIFGEGAYYAPELTKVYERRGPDFIRAMLRDPEAMYPGQRRMQNYHFDDGEIEDLLAFLTWSGRVDLNGFPPKPTLMPIAVPESGKDGAVATSVDRPQIFNQLCVACHVLGGQGGTVGPALDGIGARRDAAYLHDWLTDPRAVKADARMPKLPLTPGQVDELVAFLSHLKTGGTP